LEKLMSSAAIRSASPPEKTAASSELASLRGPDYIRALMPYVGGKPIEETAREYGLDPAKIVKLASNENPLGMPESAKRAIAKAAEDLGRYPDDNAFDLKATLSAKLNVPADWITLGSGSSDILMMAAMAFAGAQATVIYSQYGFVVYSLAAQKIGAKSKVVPATAGLGHDLDGMLAAIDANTALIYVANPGNPTGTFIQAPQIEAFLAKVPANVVVVLDEAYGEYLEPSIRPDSVAWVKRFPNLIVSRSFSKAFGLAGLRVGYGVAQPALTDLMNRVRNAFNVNSMAQAAAVAALNDATFLQKGYEVNKAGYAQLTAAFERLKLKYIPSYGNFVLVHIGDAARVNQALLKQGVIVRPVANYGLPEYLRISIGLPEENAIFIAALEKALTA
jgi:histidinol-phosphate aminotransferase